MIENGANVCNYGLRLSQFVGRRVEEEKEREDMVQLEGGFPRHVHDTPT